MFDGKPKFTTGAAFSASSPFTTGGRPTKSPAEYKATVAAFRANLRRTVQIEAASQLIPHMPGPGESVHALMLGNYDFMLVLSAFLRKHPEPCQHLRIATLTFSKKNIQEMARLMDDGVVHRITMLCSDFMDRVNNDIFRTAVEELTDNRGQALATTRVHAKVYLLQYRSSCYAFEGSANLRTNKHLEQVTVIHDRSVHDWHAAWIDQRVMDNGRNQPPK